MSNDQSPGSRQTAEQADWWGLHPPAGEPLSVVQLIRAGTLDAELAALVWLLVEARVPLLVASGPQMAGKTTVLTALLEFLPAATATRQLAGWAEAFGWLPEAERLGWRPDLRERGHVAAAAPSGPSVEAPPAGASAPGAAVITPASTYLVAAELSPHLPAYTWGEQARTAVRALSVGYGLGATIHADSLQELFDSLRGPDIRLTDDELSNLGLVLVLRAFRNDAGQIVRRIAAAHYVRPVSRDAAGHVQRLPPAVLATWNDRGDTFEHFAWGLVPELARRVGRRAGDFEVELGRRQHVLAGLAAAGVDSFHDVRTALNGYRFTPTGHRH